MRIKVIHHRDDWQQHEQDWQAVYDANPNHTPFQSYEWQANWWKHLGSGQLYILRIDTDSGDAIGFAPFFLRKRFFGVPLRHLCFIGAKRTDYLDFLVRQGEEQRFFTTLFQFLRDQQGLFSFIELKDFPETSANLPYFKEAVKHYFPLYSIDTSRICVAVPFPEKWDAYVASLGKSLRSNLRYYSKRLDKNFEVEWREYHRNGEDLEAGFNGIVQVYNERWLQEKGATRYTEPAAAAFERAAFLSLARRDEFRLWLLHLNGEPAATLAGFVRNNKVFDYCFAHSPKFHEHSVGTVLIGHAIERCINDNMRELDLSRGDEEYKFKFQGREKRNLHVKIYPDHKAMALSAAAEQVYLSATESAVLQRLLSRYRKVKHSAPATNGAKAEVAARQE